MTKTRNKLKIMGLLLTLVMMVSLVGLFSLTASAEDTTTNVCTHSFTDGVCTTCGVMGGYCGGEGDGTNLVWTLDKGNLTITGTGAMADYDSYTDSPWYDYRNSITALSIPEGVTTVGRVAFFYTAGLKSVTIPASVKKLGYGAFINSGLESVTFAEGSQLTTIDQYAFQNCEALTEITLPAGVTSITYTVFSGCSALTDIHVAEGNTAHKDIDGVLYTADGTTLVIYPQGKTAESYTTPDGVTTIGECAFYSNLYTKSITLSEGVTTINGCAFQCYALETLSLPDSLITIGDSAFCCEALTEITIPTSVTSIGDYAFDECSALTTVNAPCTWDENPLYTFGEGVTLNKVLHSYVNGVCASCNEACPGHTGGEATCTTQAVCATCGASYGELGGHTFVDLVCTECGKAQIEIIGQQLNIGGDLAMKYYVEVLDQVGMEFDPTHLRMEFIHNGVVTTLAYKIVDGFFVFTLDGINPQCMGDNIYAKLFYMDEEVANHGYGEGKEYSVEKNLNNLLKDYPDDAALATLVNDILAYGKSASAYKKHDTMAGDYAVSDSTIPDATVTPNGAFTGYTVVFGQVNHIKIGVTLAEGHKLYLDGTDITTQLVGGIYRTNGIAPTEFDKKFSFEIKNGDTSVLTFAVSVNDYVSVISQISTNEKMVALAKALYNYGVSAEAYHHTKTGVGAHIYENGVCLCGAECDHNGSQHETATDNGDGTHGFTCTVCNGIGSEQHSGVSIRL